MWALKPWPTRRGTWEGGSSGLQNRPWKPQRAGSQDLFLTQSLALGCPGEDVTLGEAAQIAEADAEADNSWRTWPQLLGRKWKSLSHVWLFVTPWTVAWQAPLSMEFSRQDYWRGLPCPSPGDLPDPGFKLRSLALQADSLPRLQGFLKGALGSVPTRTTRAHLCSSVTNLGSPPTQTPCICILSQVLLWGELTPRQWMYLRVHIHSPINGHPSCLQSFATAHYAALDLFVPVSFHICRGSFKTNTWRPSSRKTGLHIFKFTRDWTKAVELKLRLTIRIYWEDSFILKMFCIRHFIADRSSEPFL